MVCEGSKAFGIQIYFIWADKILTYFFKAKTTFKLSSVQSTASDSFPREGVNKEGTGYMAICTVGIRMQKKSIPYAIQ